MLQRMRSNEIEALLSTTDLFIPMVKDACIVGCIAAANALFGCIAAANALSDIYAMGGELGPRIMGRHFILRSEFWSN